MLNHPVFSKNRHRLIEHGAVTELFNATVEMAEQRGLLAYQISDVLDTGDAVKVAKAVAALPQSNRTAINWHNVKPVSPKRACQELGTTMEGLARLVRDGRQMLSNREARCSHLTACLPCSKTPSYSVADSSDRS